MISSSRVCDVMVVGAGVMGASLSFWLSRLQPGLRIVLVDQDFLFARASSALSASSIRQQFSCPVNIQLSSFGIRFLRNVSELLAMDANPIDLGLKESGYLYLANKDQADALEAAHLIQREQGADVALLSASELRRRFPWLSTDDIAVGSLGLSGEGWFDGPALHQAFLRKAIEQGVVRYEGRVVDLVTGGRNHQGSRQLTSIVFDNGVSWQPGIVVNAAGAWSAKLAKMVGFHLPISPSRRTVFVVSSPVPLPDCPLIIDPSGFWLRPEGPYFLTGTSPKELGDDLALEPDFRELDETQWQRLAQRIPSFQALRIERAWAGYYEMNHFDHNAVLGPHPEIPNLFFMTGFSGHGIQHAPGAGLGLAEWILTGAPQSIDLRPLSVERIFKNQPLFEMNIIG